MTEQQPDITINILDVAEMCKEKDIEILQLRSVIRQLSMQLNEKDKAIKEFAKEVSNSDEDKDKKS